MDCATGLGPHLAALFNAVPKIVAEGKVSGRYGAVAVGVAVAVRVFRRSGSHVGIQG